MAYKSFSVEEAGGKRKCLQCTGEIKKGEKCLAFHYGSGMNTVTGNLCGICTEIANLKIKGKW
jgi:hypothetical protein